MAASLLTGLGTLDLAVASPRLVPAPPPTAVGAGAEEITLHLLYQLITILVTTQIVSRVVRPLGLTPVSGEMLAGLLLGPSLLGALFPTLGKRL